MPDPDLSRLFDAPSLRGASDSLRWGRHQGRDVIPLWVADMDFRSPQCVLDALAARVAEGVFGYASQDAALRVAIGAYLERTYRWTIAPEWLVFLPGAVSGLHLAVRQLTTSGQAVLVPQPVYPPFRRAAERAPRRRIDLPLVLDRGRWMFDWDRLDQAVVDGARLLSFANPHNPGGTVFREAELVRLAEFCCRHDLLMCSDEIHAGLVLEPGLRHQPVAALDRRYSRRCVTLMSLTKTYNFAGCGMAWAVIEDPGLRQAFARDLHAIVADASLFGPVATLAALADGEAWRQAVVGYLRGNRDHLLARLPELPGVRCDGLEATYLAWLDCRAGGIEDPAARFLAHGVALSPGSEFGAPGFARLNFAVPRARLDQAIDRMAHALAAGG